MGTKPLILITCLAVVGGACMLYATRNGLIIFTDSALYIMGAQNLIEGKGLSEITPEGELSPAASAPPLFPILLAILSIFGFDPLIGMRWLNSLLFGANVFLTGILINMFSPNLWIAICGLLIMTSSPIMLEIHSMVMTEPLFIFLNLLSILLLAKYLKSSKLGFLLAFSLVTSFVCMTKYTGIALLPVGIFGIMFLCKQKKIFSSIIFISVTFSFIAPWIIRNLLTGCGLIGYEISYHPVKLIDIKSGLLTIANWFEFRNILRINPVIVLLPPLIVGGVLKVFIKWRKDLPLTLNRDKNRTLNFIPLLMAIFILSYLVSLIVAKTFFASDAEPCQRYFSPLYIPGLIIVVYLVNKLYQIFNGLILFKAVLLGILFYITVNCAYTGKSWFTSFKGAGYGSQTWRDSEIIKKINELPTDAIIISNKEDAIYILCKRVAWPLPVKIHYNTLKPNEDYFKQIAHIKKKLQKSHGGFIVYFHIQIEERNKPSEGELKEQLPLRLFWKGDEGIIYKFENQ